MDLVKDTSFKVFSKLARQLGYKLPSYVAEYTPEQDKIASELPSEAFACPALREYPIDSKATTWLSALYAADSVQQTGKEAQAAADALPLIKAAAIIWDTLSDVEQVIDTVSGLSIKQASDTDGNYGWIDRDAAGNVTARRYGIFDKAGVTKAAGYFLENRDSYHYKTREKVASFILAKAGEYGVSRDVLGEELAKEAGHGIPVKAVIVEELKERALLAKHAECGTLLANVNRLLDVCDPAELPDVMDKVATLVNEFDTAEDLTRHYGKRITRPSEFLRSLSEKTAEAMVATAVQIDGKTFDYVKLAAAVPVNEFYLALGPGFAARVSESGVFDEDNAQATKVAAAKLKQALTELSAGEQETLYRHLVAMCD